jgi:FAD/FMN-containing dehydrogenase
VRALGSRHSVNSLICCEGSLISTARLRRIIRLDHFHGEETVVVEPGVQLGQLADWLHERGKALGFAFPNIRRVTIAGAVSTGAHGSSWTHDAIISSLVRELAVITPEGSLVVHDRERTPASLWKALLVSLGALGVVVRLRLKVVDQFNVEITTSFLREEALIKPSGVVTWLDRTDYDQYVWFPRTRKIMRVAGRITNERPVRPARNTLLVKDMTWPSFVAHGAILSLGRRSAAVNALIERSRYRHFKRQPPFAVKTATGRWRASRRVVGPSHRMLISELPKRERYFHMSDWEFAIPVEHTGQALTFMRNYFRARRLALPMFGVVLRFAPCRDDTWIGHTVRQGAFQTIAVLVDFLVYEPKARDVRSGDGNDRVWSALAKAFVTEFHGRPHWGKNQDWVFGLARDCSVYGSNLERFEEQRQSIDPHGVFSNAFVDRLFK